MVTFPEVEEQPFEHDDVLLKHFSISSGISFLIKNIGYFFFSSMKILLRRDEPRRKQRWLSIVYKNGNLRNYLFPNTGV